MPVAVHHIRCAICECTYVGDGLAAVDVLAVMLARAIEALPGLDVEPGKSAGSEFEMARVHAEKDGWKLRQDTDGRWLCPHHAKRYADAAEPPSHTAVMDDLTRIIAEHKPYDRPA